MRTTLIPSTGLRIDEESTPMERIRSVLVDPLQPDDPELLADDWQRSFSIIEDVEAPQRAVEDVLSKRLEHWDTDAHRPIREAFAVQAAASRQLLAPSPSILWSHATDVIPAAQAMTQGQPGSHRDLLVGLTYLHSPPALGVYGMDRDHLRSMLAYVSERASMLDLSVDVRSLIHQFASMQLRGSTQTVMLRANRSDPLVPGSFGHTVVALIEEFISRRTNGGLDPAPKVGLLPFDAEELIDPTSLVLVDVSEVAAMSAPASTAEWALTQLALDPAQPRVFRLDTIVNLSTSLRDRIARTLSKNGHQVQDNWVSHMKSSVPEFLSQQPRESTIIEDLIGIIEGTGTVSFSHNVEKTRRRTYARPNRRDPNNSDRPGRTIMRRFKRDLHVYGDTSGSMSDDNLLSMMRVVVALAQELDVNLYFSSFSDMLSEETLLQVHGRTFEDVWDELLNLPKVTGRTDFSQIWRYIDANPDRRDRISLVVTDFGWKNRATSINHPPHLYYAPVQVDDSQWHVVRGWSKTFVGSMQRVAPDIATRLVGMIR